tara:strand:+ start:167 stop:451 length:285 start_codon:yes stop_codon:yes gene_type:complete
MSNLLTKYKFELSNSLERMINEEQAEAIKEDMKFARRFLNLLVARLDKELDDKIQESEAQLNYENPNWELKQAELLGYRRAIRKIKEIIRPIEE